MAFYNTFKDFSPDKLVTSPEIYLDKELQIFHPEGVYSEQIFGPIKNYKCQCDF